MQLQLKTAIDAVLGLGASVENMKSIDRVQGLPPGWGKRVTTNGKVYFCYHPTRSTSWVDPRLVPLGWEARLEPDGTMFFYSHKFQTWTYTDPRGLQAGWQMRIMQSKTSEVCSVIH